MIVKVVAKTSKKLLDTRCCHLAIYSLFIRKYLSDYTKLQLNRALTLQPYKIRKSGFGQIGL